MEVARVTIRSSALAAWLCRDHNCPMGRYRMLVRPPAPYIVLEAPGITMFWEVDPETLRKPQI